MGEMQKLERCIGPTINGNTHPLTKAKWLEIDHDFAQQHRYYRGWYCPYCHLMLGRGENETREIFAGE